MSEENNHFQPWLAEGRVPMQSLMSLYSALGVARRSGGREPFEWPSDRVAGRQTIASPAPPRSPSGIETVAGPEMFAFWAPRRSPSGIIVETVAGVETFALGTPRRSRAE